ncbi:tyrosine-type recombinase/integrase [Nonlabens xiamenensis]|uniref:tyrosine-type recombinase/integrase n=1 Tax=Nonlabens xiamenensis TaxID=2341043 RepID=UPI000F612C8F|nr:tyrosine-type recombinase/integrase [Nonlabens xiamenensis]
MYLQEFLDYLELERHYSKHTLEAYARDLDQFIAYLEEEMVDDIKEVNYSLIRGWIASLLEDGVTSRTVNRKLSSLKSYFKFLRRTEVLERNPMLQHKSLKVSKNVQVPFSKEEVFQLLDAPYDVADFESSRDRLMIEMLYVTGIRREEMITLKLVDVDVAHGQIKVLGKRNKERYVPMVNSMKKHIQSYLLLREAVTREDTEEFFITAKGVKIYSSLVYRVVKSYFSKVSLKVKISPHILRHTFATHLLDEGADLNAVKELLGHASLSSTQVYTHSSMAALKGVYSDAHPRSKK